MRSEFLSFSPPLIGQEEIDEVVDTLRSDWITTGPKTRRFESEFAADRQAEAALALNSCTAGLHTTLLTMGIGAGDEVITTPMTFAASVNVIELVGAKPVLVDVEPDTLNIDPRAVERAVTAKTRAVLAVHYAGHPADMAAIQSIADSHQLAVIEDAAHAIPASYRDRPIGSGSNPTAFSFYATKNLTTGEGGMLTGPADFLEEARVISLHGMSREAWKRYEKGGSWRYDVVAPGCKYNMTDIQASLGIWQLKKLPLFQQRRAEIVGAYNAAFQELGELELPVVRDNVEHAWHLYPIRLVADALRIGRDEFIEELKARRIGTSVHFIPIHIHPFYRDKYGLEPNDLPVANDNFERILSLPLNPRMSEQDVADVIEAVDDVARRHRRRRRAA
ncbi:MAG: DegT/DnrJ/EryC1/StrS aminotransferase family protein [Pirellulaceae bacterium]|jgi:dTDP-4-amino-4,6-dideoxygalactose transaminase|nr:DegT/DnrJ/EryC1/StrS aminotransferase family protein [Pirellulaceae bacterium]MDP7019380.1 DegT/DnrJ/EryC1/StrS aminotransferase family protein [Pirellulaceae bacterium]